MARKKKVVAEEAVVLDSNDEAKQLIDEAPVAEKVLIDEKVTPAKEFINETPVVEKEVLVETPAVEEAPAETINEVGITIENVGHMSIDRSIGIKSDGETLKRTLTYPDGRVRVMYETLSVNRNKS